MIDYLKSESDEIMTHAKYCEKMEKKGLASSLMVSGRIVYRANFSRSEILNAFVKAYSLSDESGNKDTISKYIELIQRCYDLSTYKTSIPG